MFDRIIVVHMKEIEPDHYEDYTETETKIETEVFGNLVDLMDAVAEANGYDLQSVVYAWIRKNLKAYGLLHFFKENGFVNKKTASPKELPLLDELAFISNTTTYPSIKRIKRGDINSELADYQLKELALDKSTIFRKVDLKSLLTDSQYKKVLGYKKAEKLKAEKAKEKREKRKEKEELKKIEDAKKLLEGQGITIGPKN